MHIIVSVIRSIIRIILRKNKCKDSELQFAAQVQLVTKETRFKSTVIICTILLGSVNKGDTVLLVDHNKTAITKAKISEINYKTKSVECVFKNDDNNDIGLEFFGISDKPIQNTKYVLK